MVEALRPNYAEKPLISPRQSIRIIAKYSHLKFEELKVPRCILLSLSVGATQLLIRETEAEEFAWIYRARPLYVGNISGNPVGIIWAAPGAPLATMVVEDLVACGAKLFVGVGLLAATQPRINVGNYVIPSLAVRDEGTSRHYLPEDVIALSSDEVIQALQDSCEEFKVKYYVGPVCTTDAPYRETKSKINYLQRKGVLGIDMESSAIFALGIYRKVKVGCILVASSNLTQPKTTIGFYTEKSRDAMLKAVKISIEAVRKLQHII